MNPFSINEWIVLAGICAALGVIKAVMRWQERQRKLRNVRPPVSRKLLRPPGHGLAIQLEQCEDTLDRPFVVALAAGAGLALATVALGSLALNEAIHAHWANLIVGSLLLIGCALGLLHGVKGCSATRKQMRNLRLGLRGEQAVAEVLSEVAVEGYRAFHDYPGGDNWNIDHVVVGPGGVFAIETKTRSKQKAPASMKDYVVFYDGATLQFPWGADRDAVGQVKANARSLGGLLSKATGMEVRVDPVLVVPGWWVERTSNPAKHGLRAMPDTALPKYLKGLPRILTDQQIQQIAHQIDSKCRDVEF